MNARQVQDLLLQQYGIRVGRQTADYVLASIGASHVAGRVLPVIGRDARTGLPMRVSIGLDKFRPAGAPTEFAGNLFAGLGS